MPPHKRCMAKRAIKKDTNKKKELSLVYPLLFLMFLHKCGNHTSVWCGTLDKHLANWLVVSIYKRGFIPEKTYLTISRMKLAVAGRLTLFPASLRIHHEDNQISEDNHISGERYTFIFAHSFPPVLVFFFLHQLPRTIPHCTPNTLNNTFICSDRESPRTCGCCERPKRYTPKNLQACHNGLEARR